MQTEKYFTNFKTTNSQVQCYAIRLYGALKAWNPLEVLNLRKVKKS